MALFKIHQRFKGQFKNQLRVFFNLIINTDLEICKVTTLFKFVTNTS